MAVQAEHNEHTEHEHITPTRVYLGVYAALLLLLFATVGAALFHPPAFIAVGIMLAIAIIKASLVVLFFMGVYYNTRLTWVWAGIGFIWLLIMFTVIFDHLTRSWIKVSGW